MRQELTRRTFVSGALAGAGLAWLVPIGCGRRGPDPQQVASGLRPLIGHGQAAWQVGHAFLDRHPDDRDAGSLARWLAERLGWTEDGFAPGVAARFVAAVREDFQRGEHVIVRGWRLAVTEARAAGLIALVLPAPEAALYDPPSDPRGSME